MAHRGQKSTRHTFTSKKKIQRWKLGLEKLRKDARFCVCVCVGGRSVLCCPEIQDVVIRQLREKERETEEDCESDRERGWTM